MTNDEWGLAMASNKNSVIKHSDFTNWPRVLEFPFVIRHSSFGILLHHFLRERSQARKAIAVALTNSTQPSNARATA
jgi:hypothetical protein